MYPTNLSLELKACTPHAMFTPLAHTCTHTRSRRQRWAVPHHERWQMSGARHAHYVTEVGLCHIVSGGK
jgi:hypothetical protein